MMDPINQQRISERFSDRLTSPTEHDLEAQNADYG